MKMILYWDPRFPRRAPQRLILPDAIASAFVRAGVAAAADPAQQGAIAGAGGALDPGTPTEIVIEHGLPGMVAMVRVIVPLSVARIALGIARAASQTAVTFITAFLNEDGSLAGNEDGSIQGKE